MLEISRDLEIEKGGKDGGPDGSRSRSCYLGLGHARGARFAQIYQTWMVQLAKMGGEKWRMSYQVLGVELPLEVSE